MGIRVYRAPASEIQVAYRIVLEYYEAAAVLVREDACAFLKDYFVDGGGVWLAEDDGIIVACIALRALQGKPGCGEIKRLYVRPSHRGTDWPTSYWKHLRSTRTNSVTSGSIWARPRI